MVLMAKTAFIAGKKIAKNMQQRNLKKLQNFFPITMTCNFKVNLPKFIYITPNG